MERTTDEALESVQQQTIKTRVLSAVGSARNTASARAANATAMARNPLGMAIGSVAVGFLAGMLLPVTEIERERFGSLGERLTDEARTAAVNAINEGKTAVALVIDDALSRAGGTDTDNR